MQYKIIADSCSDVPMETQRQSGVSIVPLTITMDEQVYVDDSGVDMNGYLKNMQEAGKMTSGAPAPGKYLENLQKGAVNLIVTLSSKLSGSYQSANAAKSMLEAGEFEVEILDSKTASAGELLIVNKLMELTDAGGKKEDILAAIRAFIDRTETYFMSQDLGNFIRNGRLSKVKGTLLTILGIRPILGADGNGQVKLFTQARGDNQVINKFLELIGNSKKSADGGDLVITHCGNPELAQRLRTRVEERFHFGRIIITETKALSSMYVGTKGIIIAF